MSTETEPRPIFVIAEEIISDWKKVHFAAKPYLEAMKYMSTMQDCYGLDSAKEIILRFLCNAKTWYGETARRVKAELKEMAK